MTNIYSISDMVAKGNNVFINTKVDNTFLVIDNDGRGKIFPCDRH